MNRLVDYFDYASKKRELTIIHDTLWTLSNLVMPSYDMNELEDLEEIKEPISEDVSETSIAFLITEHPIWDRVLKLEIGPLEGSTIVKELSYALTGVLQQLIVEDYIYGIDSMKEDITRQICSLLALK